MMVNNPRALEPELFLLPPEKDVGSEIAEVVKASNGNLRRAEQDATLSTGRCGDIRGLFKRA
ncbi:MAG: hypothetical protein ACFE8Z_04065 [Candidatus Hermodarchaeota archaeon]